MATKKTVTENTKKAHDYVNYFNDAEKLLKTRIYDADVIKRVADKYVSELRASIKEVESSAFLVAMDSIKHFSLKKETRQFFKESYSLEPVVTNEQRFAECLVKGRLNHTSQMNFEKKSDAGDPQKRFNLIKKDLEYLAIITGVEVKLIPAGKYGKLFFFKKL